MIIRYYAGRNGTVERELVVKGTKRALRGEYRPARHQSETILKALYELECRDGCRFRSGYTKSVLKHVHETALERYDQTGQEY